VRVIFVDKIISFLEYLLHLRVTHYLSNNLKPPANHDYIIDVGANKGTTSKLYLRLFREAKIVAIEPLPIFNVESKRIDWERVALSDIEGYRDFFICAHTASSTLILPISNSRWYLVKSRILGLQGKDLYEASQVKVSTLDKVIEAKQILSIFLLKIDTEGAELDILKGGLKSLQLGKVKNIQIESQGNGFRESNRDEIFDLLANFNYMHTRSIKHFFGSLTEEFFTLKVS